MSRIEKSVFISYRRTNFPWAMLVYQNLVQQGYDVFIDYKGIGSGEFRGVIFENIRSHAHFLVLLSPSALERCKDPDDLMRQEIETALESQRNIVPIMLEGFSFSTPEIDRQLTGRLARLKNYNGITIPPDYFIEAMAKLNHQFLEVPLAAQLATPSPQARQAAEEQKALANAAAPVEKQELTEQQVVELKRAPSVTPAKIAQTQPTFELKAVLKETGIPLFKFILAWAMVIVTVYGQLYAGKWLSYLLRDQHPVSPNAPLVALAIRIGAVLLYATAVGALTLIPKYLCNFDKTWVAFVWALAFLTGFTYFTQVGFYDRPPVWCGIVAAVWIGIIVASPDQ